MKISTADSWALVALLGAALVTKVAAATAKVAKVTCHFCAGSLVDMPETTLQSAVSSLTTSAWASSSFEAAATEDEGPFIYYTEPCPSRVLLCACEKGDLAVVQSIMSRCRVSPSDTLACIKIASMHHHEALLPLLLASPTLLPFDANDALIFAATNNLFPAVKILLGSPHIAAYGAVTALEAASGNGHAKVVSLLLSSGYVTSADLEEAIEIVYEREHHDIYHLLRQFQTASLDIQPSRLASRKGPGASI